VKVATIKLKTFEEASAAALESAYETWRAAQTEAHLVDVLVTHDGTNVIMTVFYTNA
jgi:hypothetical protein